MNERDVLTPNSTAQSDDTLGNIPQITTLMQDMAAERRDPDLFDLATAIDYLSDTNRPVAIHLVLDWCAREIQAARPGGSR